MTEDQYRSLAGDYHWFFDDVDLFLGSDTPGVRAAMALLQPGARVLDLTGDLVAYARLLYAELRSADDEGVRVLIAVLPAPEGLGLAIRDRLEKAAAPRPR